MNDNTIPLFFTINILLFIFFMFLAIQIHTSRMTLADDVNLEEFVMTKDEFSGADIKAICTEAGLLALRERRMKVTQYFLLSLKTYTNVLPVMLLNTYVGRFCLLLLSLNFTFISSVYLVLKHVHGG